MDQRKHTVSDASEFLQERARIKSLSNNAFRKYRETNDKWERQNKIIAKESKRANKLRWLACESDVLDDADKLMKQHGELLKAIHTKEQNASALWRKASSYKKRYDELMDAIDKLEKENRAGLSGWCVPDKPDDGFEVISDDEDFEVIEELEQDFEFIKRFPELQEDSDDGEYEFV